jgi:hypothetical protein
MLPVINSAIGGQLSTDFLAFARRVYQQREWALAYDQTSAHLSYVPVSPAYSSYPVNSSTTPAPKASLEQYSFVYYKFTPESFTGNSMSIYVNGTPAIVARAFKKDNLGNITEFPFSNVYPSSVVIANLSGAAEVVLLLVNTSDNSIQNANFSTDGTLVATDPVITTTITTPSTTTTSSRNGGSGGGGGGCFIATAAYGSYLHPQVQILRDFRDTRLLTNLTGRAFVALYYRLSPPIANFIARYEVLRLLVRLLLTPIVFAIAHPTAASALLLTAVCGMAGHIRLRKVTYNVFKNHAG